MSRKRSTNPRRVWIGCMSSGYTVGLALPAALNGGVPEARPAAGAGRAIGVLAFATFATFATFAACRADIALVHEAPATAAPTATPEQTPTPTAPEPICGIWGDIPDPCGALGRSVIGDPSFEVGNLSTCWDQRGGEGWPSLDDQSVDGEWSVLLPPDAAVGQTFDAVDLEDLSALSLVVESAYPSGARVDLIFTDGPSAWVRIHAAPGPLDVPLLPLIRRGGELHAVWIRSDGDGDVRIDNVRICR